MEFLAEDLEEFGLHQSVAQAVKDVFETDVEPVAAGPAIAGGGATK